MCQVCIRELYGTRRKYNYEGLQVHHAVPVNSSEELRLDDSNLITVCAMHHAMCDKGEIPYDEVKQIILEQEGDCIMLVKELYIEHPFSKEIEVLKNVEAEDATEFKGFIRVKLLGSTEVPGKDSVFFFNRNSITKIVPELLK